MVFVGLDGAARLRKIRMETYLRARERIEITGTERPNLKVPFRKTWRDPSLHASGSPFSQTKINAGNMQYGPVQTGPVSPVVSTNTNKPQ